MAQPAEESLWLGLWRGYCAAANIWGLGIFIQMLSYAALARELGWHLTAVMVSTVTVWGLPGQIAMIDLMASGAGFLTVAIAVFMANARMMAMTVSSLPIIHHPRFFRRVLMAQTIGVTSWLYTVEKLSVLPKPVRQTRFFGFYLFQLTAALAGTVMGYYAADFFDDRFMRVLLFISPLFLLLIISASKTRHYVVTSVIGGAVGLALQPYIGVSAILLAGVLCGSLGWFLARYPVRYTVKGQDK